MVCHQTSKKSGQFEVCLALRLGPKNVEFGGMSQALGRDGLIPNRPLSLVIKGLGRRLETFHRPGDCPTTLPAPPPRALFRFPSAQSEVRLSLLPLVFKGTARVTYSRFRLFGMVTFKNEESELSFQGLASRSG